MWEVVDLNRLSDMVADASLNPTIMEAVDIHDTTTTRFSVSPNAMVTQCSAPNQPSVSGIPRGIPRMELAKPASAPSSFQEEMGHRVDKLRGYQNAVVTDWIQLSDSGGQPQFHELASISVKNLSGIPRMELVKPASAPSSFQEEMGRRVDKLQGYQNTMVTDWIQLIDSGGQPQFHELASIFVKNLSGYISVFKLSEPLSHHGEVQFFINSNPINTPYASTYSNEGTIRSTLRAVQFQACKHKGRIMKLAFVATHRDEDCSAELLHVKNDRLHRMLVELLPENVRKGVISRGGSLKQVIFPFNGKNPDVHDEAVLEGLRTTLMDNPTGDKKMLPLNFHGLEIALLKLMQKLDRQVLSRQECLHIAVEIQFDEESFEVALQFLNDLNIIYYNREVLRDVVFGSSQVILDKLSEMVISSLRLREDPTMICRALDGKWRR